MPRLNDLLKPGFIISNEIPFNHIVNLGIEKPENKIPSDGEALVYQNGSEHRLKKPRQSGFSLAAATSLLTMPQVKVVAKPQ